MSSPYVIIGGDAAGMSAASKIKREQPNAQVVVLERSQVISYSACGMPYWIAGVVPSDRQLIVMTPDVARKRRGIDVRTQHEATAINPAARTVVGTNHATGQQFTQPYDKLLIATGARALLPPIVGLDLPGVFSLRALQDAQAIHAHMAAHPMRQAVIVGGGYIGVEMAEALRAQALEVTLVELTPHLLTNLDPEMMQPVMAHLQAQGVQVQMSTRVAAIEQDGSQDGSQDRSQLRVLTDKQDALPADLVIVATGVRPNAELAAMAGLRLGESGAIAVDEQMQTSDPHIWAAGDCVEHYHLVLGRGVWIPLATSANKGGRIAGENMLGEGTRFPGILGTTVVKVFDYTIASTGLPEFAARTSGLFGAQAEFLGSAMIENKDKAGYWPGAETMQVKLVFDKRDGRVVGGQLVGKAGVNKRIDIIATAISARMTVRDIGMLDLSYAPPYSPTYDPVQICANVAERAVGKISEVASTQTA